MNPRIEYLQELIGQSGFDAVVLNPGASLRWLTGLDFHLMERPVVLWVGKTGKPLIILPELEQAKLAGFEAILEGSFFGDDPSTWHEVFGNALAFTNGKDLRVGVEPTGLRYLELDLLQGALPNARFVDGSAALSSLRLLKDHDELARMKRAAEIAEEALLETLRTIQAGQTEKEIASELLVQLYRHGSDADLPFAPIVSSGPNTANPHAAPSDRAIESGDVLLFDWGARYEGYCSDITRCFFIGPVDERLQEIAKTVQRANHYAVAEVSPGMTAGQIDTIAREEIEESGFGEFFTHRTGHGLGMEAHEAPYIFAGSQLELKRGMVFTVEPGIYVPGLGGVRLEDNVVVTEDGFTSLTTLPREVKTIERYLKLMDFFRGLL